MASRSHCGALQSRGHAAGGIGRSIRTSTWTRFRASTDFGKRPSWSCLSPARWAVRGAAGPDLDVCVPSGSTFSAIHELRDSGSRDRVVILNPPDGAPEEWRPLQLRAVKLRAPDGTESFFLTTLPRSEFDRRELAELYHMRWEVEEFFKLSKGPYIGQGQFRSKSPSGVIQEIHALVLFLAISRLCMGTAAAASALDYSSLSQKAAVLGLAAYLTRILLAKNEEHALRELHALLLRIARTREKRRPGRSFPRVSFRPSPRWGPSGRRGA